MIIRDIFATLFVTLFVTRNMLWSRGSFPAAPTICGCIPARALSLGLMSKISACFDMKKVAQI
jgi:hypothetical protein